MAVTVVTFTSKPSFVPRPAKMKADNHPLRNKRDNEKVQHDNSPECYRRDSDGPHPKEDTPVIKLVTVVNRRLNVLTS